MLANRLKKARKRKKITQQEVADVLNFSRQSLSKWENGTGTPNIETLKKLSAFYELSIADLTKEEQTEIKTKISQNADESWLFFIIIIISIPIAPFGLLTLPMVFSRNTKHNDFYKWINVFAIIVLSINLYVFYSCLKHFFVAETASSLLVRVCELINDI